MDQLTGWDVARWAWGLVISVLSFLGIRQVERIDRLEANRVQKTDHEKEIERLQAELRRSSDRLEASLREFRVETQAGFARIHQRLDELSDRQ